MAWDEDLERLTLYVKDHLGEEAWQGAMQRAVAMTTGKLQPVAELPDPPLEAPGMMFRSDGTGVSLDVFYDHLRRELKRLAPTVTSGG